MMYIIGAGISTGMSERGAAGMFRIQGVSGFGLLQIGACCDYTFYGDGNLIIPWVGGRVGYAAVPSFGCFNIIWYVVETKPGWNLGAYRL